MRQALLAVIIIMSLNQTSIAQTKHAADSCHGIVSINFEIGTIPLYPHPDSIAFDVLNFEQKKVDEYVVYVIESNLKERLAPYKLMHADASVNQMRWNNKVLTTDNMWTRTHMHPKPTHKLSFKLIGEYGDWFKVELNGKTRETCYIQRNDSCMHFTSWEAIVAPALMVSFNGLPVYDKPNGNELAVNDESKRGKILALEGEWAHVHYYYGLDTGECWVKWKDETGMLLTNLIYEFIK